MTATKVLASGLLAVVASGAAHGQDTQNWKSRDDWAQTFRTVHISGVIAVCSYPEAVCQTSDETRAQQRFIPASTFKIPHLLIALDSGVTPDTNKTFKWDGTPQPLKGWERDHTYRGLLLDSVVPVFQGFARQIGETRERAYLQKFHYGNADVGGGIDRFWLDGALRISAAEQIAFLYQLYNNQIEAKPEFQWRTKDAMLIEATDTYVLRGKTGYSLGMPGTGDRSKPGVGWWVGWIEAGTHTHVFAANFDINDENDLPKRKSLPLTIFQAEGWLSAVR